MVILCGGIVVVSLVRIVGAGTTLDIEIIGLASSIIVARSRGTGGPQGRFVGLGMDHDGGGYPRNNTRGIVGEETMGVIKGKHGIPNWGLWQWWS